MGGKGSGCKPIFFDKYHESCREYQRKYNKTITTIRKEKQCSLKMAQRIHRKREALKTLEQIEIEERETEKW